ncbi:MULTISPECIES: hypothetical protein [Haloferax]|uniref:hypothetical protein n=1 Tax=Haloferax TaxID=2251 RepID=UPI0037422EF4
MAQSSRTRRRFLQLAGSGTVLSLAGCLGGGGTQETETTTAETTTTEEMEEEHEEELPEGVTEEVFERGPVPEEYQTALSQANEERDPSRLVSKEDVQFQEADDAFDAGLAIEGTNCGNCAEYIPDKNGDGFGACAKVEGYIDPEDWCVLWESIEEAEAEQTATEEHEEELPEGVTEEVFERGPVPEEYQTALSQANEERDPNQLLTKEDVQFQEADDAFDAGLAVEGTNCGNCAEYIPDKNGDGFGACAKVEGYIDPEDWCVLWESIEEAEAEQGS